MNLEPVIHVSAARARLQASLSVIDGYESVLLADSIGRCLLDPILAPFDVPACAVSAMDGYAVHAETGRLAPFSLTVTGTALAGHPAAVAVDGHTTVRIMTGAVLPDGADTVVMQEQVELRAHEAHFVHAITPGSNVRLAGEDLARGDIAVAAHRRLTASDMQRAASLGHAALRVRRRLKVALLSSGDEIRPIGAPLAEGTVYDSNRQFLLAALRQLGVSLLDFGIVADDPNRIEDMLDQALHNADLLITTGGASRGDADYVSALLQRLGDTVFAGVAMKPGRPTRLTLVKRPVNLAGLAPQLAVLSLPGTPGAMLTAFTVFATEAIELMQGSRRLGRRFSARLDGSLRGHPERTEYLPARLSYDSEGAIATAPIRRDGSARVAFDASIDALVELAPGAYEKRPGDPVALIVL
jgi:molybdopterin molybdotransferase